VTPIGTTKVLANGTELPDKRLKQFLLDLVNARVAGAGDAADAEDHTDSIFRLYQEFLPHAPRSPQEAQQNFPLLMALMRRWKKFDPRRLPKGREPYQHGIVGEMHDRLRAVWTAGDAEAAKWRLKGFESFLGEVMAAGSTSGPPAPDAPPPQRDAMAPGALPPAAPLSQALAYLGRNIRKLKKCAKRRCDTPFFIAKRQEDQCCSEECADAVRSASKKRYWRGKRQKVDEGKQPKGEPAAKKGSVKKSAIPAEQPAIADADLREFVLDVVNADDRKIDDGTVYFFTRYPAFFPTKDKDIEAVASLARRNPTLAGQLRSEFPRMYLRGLVRDLCEGLRRIWRQAKDSSTAEREFFELHSLVHRQTDIRAAGDRTLQPPPAHAPIHQALRWARQRLPKLRRCQNEDCPRHPFFVARRNERHCTEECRHAAQNATKLASWKGHYKDGKWVKNPAKGRGRPKAPAPEPERR